MIVKCYIIIICLLINDAINLETSETKQKDIQALEKEKNVLLKQIHTAIDESVSLLQANNSTQNVEGIKYMLELKQQMQTPNESDTAKSTLMEEDSRSELENRRKMIDLKAGILTTNMFHPTLGKLFDINKVINKRITGERLKQLIQSRLAMQKKLDDWILQRELEKQKIRDRYLVNKKLVEAGLYEKCPRHGFRDRKRRKRKHRRSGHHKGKKHRPNCSDDEDSSGSEKSIKPKHKVRHAYPCCRKCCKKSYLGCL